MTAHGKALLLERISAKLAGRIARNASPAQAAQRHLIFCATKLSMSVRARRQIGQADLPASAESIIPGGCVGRRHHRFLIGCPQRHGHGDHALPRAAPWSRARGPWR